MRREALTSVELIVLRQLVGDAQRQLVTLTGPYHGVSFTPGEVGMLHQISNVLGVLDNSVKYLDQVWRERIYSGQEPNRSDPRGTDAAGPARPGDDVPPGTAR
jgi:hypothetical protein